MVYIFVYHVEKFELNLVFLPIFSLVSPVKKDLKSTFFADNVEITISKLPILDYFFFRRKIKSVLRYRIQL